MRWLAKQQAISQDRNTCRNSSTATTTTLLQLHKPTTTTTTTNYYDNNNEYEDLDLYDVYGRDWTNVTHVGDRPDPEVDVDLPRLVESDDDSDKGSIPPNRSSNDDDDHNSDDADMPMLNAWPDSTGGSFDVFHSPTLPPTTSSSGPHPHMGLCDRE